MVSDVTSRLGYARGMAQAILITDDAAFADQVVDMVGVEIAMLPTARVAKEVHEVLANVLIVTAAIRYPRFASSCRTAARCTGSVPVRTASSLRPRASCVWPSTASRRRT